MIADIEQHKETGEKLQSILSSLPTRNISRKHEMEIRSEISNTVSQFNRIEERAEECLESISEIEPVAKELDDCLRQIERVNSAIHDILLDKPVIDIDLEILEAELSKIEVSFSLHV